MSVGNLKTQGNQGNNFPYQLRTLQLLGEINNSINALPGVDYETRTTTYEATAAGTGYAIGDIVVRYDIIDVATSTVTSTVWFNQTTQTTITPAPTAADLIPFTAPTNVTILPDTPVSGYVEAIADTLTYTLIPAGGSTIIYVTQILVTNAHATVGTVVNILEGGTKIYVGYAAPAGGGFSINFSTPLALSGSNPLEVSCTTTGSEVYVSANGFYK
jgi:hypothetical protein